MVAASFVLTPSRYCLSSAATVFASSDFAPELAEAGVALSIAVVVDLGGGMDGCAAAAAAVGAIDR